MRKNKMPIDDALNDIKEDPEQIIKRPVFKEQNKLFSENQKILGNYLVNNYFRTEASNSKTIYNFLETLAPFLITISPKDQSQRHSNSSDKLECTLEKDTGSIIEALRLYSDGYLEKTDLITELVNAPTIDLQEYLPEYILLKNKILKSKFANAYTLHPYLFTMGLEPKNRPLVTVTIERAINNKDIIIQKQNNNDNDNSTQMISTVPSLKMITETAKEFKITELKPIIKNINKLSTLYIKNWY
jgi:hypothetical protein